MPELLSLDRGWLFHLGDIDSPLPNTHIAAYMNHKAGWARGAARRNFDDSDWRPLDLPHDWSIEGQFHPDNHLDAGFLPRGIGWYRRHFLLDESDRGKRQRIRFDGIATHCTVYVNGHLLHRHFNGYTPFTIDITDVAQFGEQTNVIAVRVDASYMEGWWYEGAGIYRHVWLLKSSPVHIGEYGVFVAPSLNRQERQGRQERQEEDSWDTRIETTIENVDFAPRAATVVSKVLDHADLVVGQIESNLEIAPRDSATIHQSVPLLNPRRWSLAERHLYRVRSEILIDGAVVDTQETTFGYRTIRFDAERGFSLNEKPVKLLGTCNHQDHAGVGVAVPDSIHEFRIRRLLEMGTNAYRCAHNPPAEELLDACDRLGMLVMDENRTFGNDPEVLEQLHTLVRRDRNHPCVIIWSICNEESIQTSPVSGAITRAMVAEVKKLDPTRPVTAAVSGGILNDGCIGDQLEVMSINYQLPAHDLYHAKHPHRPLIAGETNCVTATRGCLITNAEKFELADDDTQTAPWGATLRDTWRFVRDRDHVAGLFMWTGFDYRGEPTPHDWPCVSSFFGQMDTCGFAKNGYWLTKAHFACCGEPFVHIATHWNHTDGGAVRVLVCSNCDEAELFLNGRSLGRKTVDPIEMVEWQVPYESGALGTVGFRGGQRAAESHVETTGPAVAVQIAPSSGTPGEGREEGGGPYRADVGSAMPLTLFATDAAGRMVPTAHHSIALQVSGAGRLLGVGNGNPTCHDSNVGNTIHLFNGLAQVIVQTSDEPGEIRIVATSPGLESDDIRLISQPAKPQAKVAVAKPRWFVNEWRRSPITPVRPDVNAEIAAQDMNTWERIDPSTTSANSWDAGGYAIYRATLKPPKSVQQNGGLLRFARIAGAIEVFIDGRAVAADAKPIARAVDVELPRDRERITVSVVVKAEANAPAGIIGRVEITPK